MIHAFALEPELVATWGRRQEFRFVREWFGLGTPRVMFELPVFRKWKAKVHEAATDLQLSDEDRKRIEELFRLFGEHRCRRSDSVYDGLFPWLVNAELEFDRKPFAGVLATANPRTHGAVLVPEQCDVTDPRWARGTGLSIAREPSTIAAALSAMLVNCRVVHLVDPHFGPENPRHRRVLEALMSVLADNQVVPEVIRVHCLAKSPLAYFETEAARMASGIPVGLSVDFVRWKQKDGGDLLHNRYVLTDLGGVLFGAGLDAGRPGQTDDLNLLSRDQYMLRWSQYVGSTLAFERVDVPRTVRGASVRRGRGSTGGR